MEICIECKLNWILCHYGGFIYSSVCPEDWQDFSDANILKAERERQSSVELRTLIDGILQQTSNDMRKQCSDVNVAFNKRISETKDTKSKLEDRSFLFLQNVYLSMKNKNRKESLQFFF